MSENCRLDSTNYFTACDLTSRLPKDEEVETSAKFFANFKGDEKTFRVYADLFIAESCKDEAVDLGNLNFAPTPVGLSRFENVRVRSCKEGKGPEFDAQRAGERASIGFGIGGSLGAMAAGPAIFLLAPTPVGAAALLLGGTALLGWAGANIGWFTTPDKGMPDQVCTQKPLSSADPKISNCVIAGLNSSNVEHIGTDELLLLGEFARFSTAASNQEDGNVIKYVSAVKEEIANISKMNCSPEKSAKLIVDALTPAAKDGGDTVGAIEKLSAVSSDHELGRILEAAFLARAALEEGDMESKAELVKKARMAVAFMCATNVSGGSQGARARMLGYVKELIDEASGKVKNDPPAQNPKRKGKGGGAGSKGKSKTGGKEKSGEDKEDSGKTKNNETKSLPPLKKYKCTFSEGAYLKAKGTPEERAAREAQCNQ